MGEPSGNLPRPALTKTNRAPTIKTASGLAENRAPLPAPQLSRKNLSRSERQRGRACYPRRCRFVTLIQRALRSRSRPAVMIMEMGLVHFIERNQGIPDRTCLDLFA
jgi:hypothetical protein